MILPFLRLLLAASLLFCLSTAASSAPIVAKSSITGVTVYSSGAMVSREASVRVPGGVTVVKVPLLSPLLNQSSVQVGLEGDGLQLSGVSYDAEVPDRASLTSHVADLCRRAASLRDSIDVLVARNHVLSQEEDLVQQNKALCNGNASLDAQRLGGVAQFLRRDLSEVASLKIGNNKAICSLQKRLSLLQQQVALAYSQQICPSSVLLVKVKNLTTSVQACRLMVSYMVPNAQWSPFYEVRVGSPSQPVQLVRKANIRQSSKEDWTGVGLSLTLQDPGASALKPELGRYVLPYGGVEVARGQNGGMKNVLTKVVGIVYDDRGPLQGALVSCGDIKAATDSCGYYEILVPRFSSLSFSYSGYLSQSAQAREQNVQVANVRLSADNSQLYSLRPYVSAEPSASSSANDDEEAVAYGSSAARPRRAKPALGKLKNAVLFADAGADAGTSSPDNAAEVLDMACQAPSASPFAREQSAIRTYTAQVLGLSSVKADNSLHEVSLGAENVGADFVYHVVPRESNNAFLMAKIPGWNSLDLLSGQMRLFVGNMFVGNSYLDGNNQSDTLSLSVGVDRDILVSRTDLKNKTKRVFLSKQQKAERVWGISVKNNKPYAVMVVVEDLYPISNNGDVKVELTSDGGASVDKANGHLTWSFSLAPGEKKEVRFSYSAKNGSNRPFYLE